MTIPGKTAIKPLILFFILFLTLFPLSENLSNIPASHGEAGPGSGASRFTQGTAQKNENISDEMDKVTRNPDQSGDTKGIETPPETEECTGKPSVLEDLDKRPQAKPTVAPKILDKKEGVLRGYSIRFRDKAFSFSSTPIAYVDGKVFISTKDPDFKRLFEALGLTYSWFSYSGKLFIYLPQGSITWQVKEDTAQVGPVSYTHLRRRRW